MADHLVHWAEERPDDIAIIDDRGPGEHRQLSWAELNQYVNRLANGLLDVGLGRDERLLWCGPNTLEVVAAIHAARKLGVMSVPLPYRLTADEARYIAEDCGATVAWVDAEYADLVTEIAADVTHLREVVVHGGPAGHGLAADDVLGTEDEPGGGDGSGRVMIYTSGTTGRPKGAVRRVGGDPGQFGALLELMGWRSDDRFLTTGPLYHSGPSGFALRAQITGGTVITQRHFDPEDWLRIVDEHRVTTTFSAPTPIRRVCRLPADVKARYDTSSMRCLIANAAPWTMSLKRMYLEDFPPESLWEVYGSTELSVNTVLAPEDQLRKPGSCGQPAPGNEIVLFDDDGQQVTEPGVNGELFVRSAGLFETYHNQPDRYAEDHREGFQTVGDIAYFDDEGYFYICDRKKDMIISGGVNIYPAEIENVLDHHPDVVEAAVFGLPDEEWGEQVCAAVVPEHDGVDVRVLAEHARGQLAGFKVPKRIELVTELPKTGSGKVLKRELKKRLGASDADIDETLAADRHEAG